MSLTLCAFLSGAVAAKNGSSSGGGNNDDWDDWGSGGKGPGVKRASLRRVRGITMSGLRRRILMTGLEVVAEVAAGRGMAERALGGGGGKGKRLELGKGKEPAPAEEPIKKLLVYAMPWHAY